MIPIVCDLFSHTFAEAIHIATIHAKYGNNHLEKEIANTGTDNNKNQNTFKSTENLIPHILTEESNCDPIINKFSKYYLGLKTSFVEPVFILNPAPPPKFS